MTARRRIGVLASAPIEGRCKPGLLAGHGPRWVAGLAAAMLRDTLDGLLSVDAEDYVVFATPLDGLDGESLALDVLERHVPRPWRIVPRPEVEPAGRVLGALTALCEDGAFGLLLPSDAPSLPTEPLAGTDAPVGSDTLAIAAAEDGGCVAVGTSRPEPRLFEGLPYGTPALAPALRARAEGLGFRVQELPAWYDVDRPSDVLRLLDELRRHPERAPRTAHYLVTAG